MLRSLFSTLFCAAALFAEPGLAAPSALPLGEPPRVIVIDDPETLPELPLLGSLYDGPLATSSTRVFFFETLSSSPSPTPRHIRVSLHNTSQQPQSFTITGELRGPGAQPTTVGEVALACYFIDRSDSKTRSVNIASGGSYKMIDELVRGTGMTISGIFDIRGTTPNAIRLTATVTGADDPEPVVPPAQFAAVKPWRSGFFDLTGVSPRSMVIDVSSVPAPLPSPSPFATLGDDCATVPRINDGAPKPTVRYGGPPYLCFRYRMPMDTSTCTATMAS